VLLYDLGDSFLVKALTEKGETFLNQAQGGKEADEKTLKAGEDLAGSAADKIEYKVSTDKLKDRVQTELFNAPFWDDVAFACRTPACFRSLHCMAQVIIQGPGRSSVCANDLCTSLNTMWTSTTMEFNAQDAAGVSKIVRRI
jgi:hypothetical protein